MVGIDERESDEMVMMSSEKKKLGRDSGNVIAKSLSDIKIGDEEIKYRAEKMFEELSEKLVNLSYTVRRIF